MTDMTLTAMTTTGPAAPRTGRRSFAAARRHSRLVWFLKRAIPLGSSLAVLAVAVIGIFDPFRTIGAVSIGPVNLSGTRITMEQPRLSGFRAKDAKPYEVTAETATQDIRQPTIVEMTKLAARVELADNGLVRLEAEAGTYDTQQEQISLKRNVRVRSDKGYDVLFQSAFVDFKAGSVTSDDPVQVKFTEGTIAADRVRITDGGRVMTFEGRVSATFNPPETGADMAPSRPQPSLGAAP